MNERSIEQLNQVYQGLSNYKRREIIRRLADSDEIDVNALSDDLATELDQNPETVKVQLHHRDLPKLKDAGLVDYDRKKGSIERGDDFEKGRKLLPS